METEEITATVGRCVSCVAQDLASCDIELFDVTNREKPTQIFEHEFLTLFSHINPVWQPNLFWQHVVADLMVEGNSFNWLDLRGGRPFNLLRLRPQQMHIKDHPQKIVSGYVFVDELGGEHPYNFEEIMHIRTRNLSSPYRGLGEIARLRDTILLDREIKNFQYHRFKNGLPVGLLIKTTRNMGSEEELEQFSSNIASKFAGSEKSGRPMIFQKGEFEIDQVARPSEEEIAFLKSMEWTRGEIGMMFGVPPSRLGVYSDVRANSDIEIRSYWEDTILGWQRLIAQYLNSVLIPRFWGGSRRLEVRWNTKHVRALQASEKMLAEVNEIGVRSGWMTPNEARQRIGLDAFADKAADKIYFNGRPVGEDPLAALNAALDPKPKQIEDEKDKPAAKAIPHLRVIPSRLLNEDDEVARLRARVRAIIQEMYRLAGEELLDLSKVPGGSVGFSVSDPAVIAFIETQSINVSQSVVKTTIEMVREAIARGIREGTPIPGLREAIQEAFEERRASWQLDRIARTEVHQAQEGGGWLAAKQNGIEFKRWTSSRDSKVRGTDDNDTSDHVSLDGQVLGMDIHFVDPRSGARLLFPGEAGAPPGDVINCRCTWVADFSHLRSWEAPDYDRVWLRKVTTAAQLERAMRRFFEREIDGMEDRALAEFDKQTAAAAA